MIIAFAKAIQPFVVGGFLIPAEFGGLVFRTLVAGARASLFGGFATGHDEDEKQEK